MYGCRHAPPCVVACREVGIARDGVHQVHVAACVVGHGMVELGPEDVTAAGEGPP